MEYAGGAGIHEPSPLFGRSAVRQPCPTVDLMGEATDACAASRRPSSFLFAPVQTNGVPEEISTSVASSTVDDSGIASGRDTLQKLAIACQLRRWQHARMKRKVGNYTVQEHLLLLQIMSSNPSSFNASESSPEWSEVNL
jgi:hypothetical protein